ncbi:9088_t:CDS:2 [Scutellospora calospora]|uniref:9088_t:CDS:1 n=1 Tax=Scutellospora calospora TaxID=85575 RepID=A0ACA9LBW5_9GLOM|nr:9088_t:CDS:2 [Scutellospora calospora]
MVVPVYIGEISPTFHRGKLVTINILMVTGGEFASYLISILFSIPEHGWQWLFGITVIPSLIQLIFMYFIPESPRFLLRREIDEIYDTISQDATGSYKQLIGYPNLKPLIIACSLQAFQNLSGFSVTMFYGATIMKMIGFNSSKIAITSSLIVTGTNFLTTAIAVLVIDRVFKSESCIDYGTNCEACLIDDRCRFIISGTSGTCVQNNGTLLEDQLNTCQSTNVKGAWLTLFGLFFYVIAYALGLGNVPWTVQGELFPLNIRGRAAGISTATNWLISLTIAVSFLPLVEELSIVETSKKSLEEIRNLFL